jgi:hypothetical protein
MDRRNLPIFLGESYDDLYPFINAEPLMNINFIEPVLFQELLAYPDYHIAHPDRACEELIRRRDAGALNSVDIYALLGIDENNPLGHYLGSITWFWEISIRGGGRSRKAVICRLPPGRDHPEGFPPEYTIIEERFE